MFISCYILDFRAGWSPCPATHAAVPCWRPKGLRFLGMMMSLRWSTAFSAPLTPGDIGLNVDHRGWRCQLQGWVCPLPGSQLPRFLWNVVCQSTDITQFHSCGDTTLHVAAEAFVNPDIPVTNLQLPPISIIAQEIYRNNWVVGSIGLSHRSFE